LKIPYEIKLIINVKLNKLIYKLSKKTRRNLTSLVEMIGTVRSGNQLDNWG
jgi:hypothetical protein